MHPPARDYMEEESIDARIPQPPRKVGALYDRGDGTATLQSMMGLRDNPETFGDILETIRVVWQELGVNHRVSYGLQDPVKLRKVKLEVTKRLPFLATDYDDAWPVTAYLKRALRSRGRRQRSEGRRRENDHDEADYQYDGPPLRGPGRRQGPTRASRKSKDRHGSDSSTTRASAQASVAPQVPRHSDSRVRRRDAVAPYSSPSSSSRTYRSTPQSTASTSTISTQRRLDTASSDSSTSRSMAPKTGSLNPPSTTPAARREPNAELSTTVLTALRSYHLPEADAERVAKLLASMGIVDTAYLRVLARMHGRDKWLYEMRDKGELTEIQMRVLREILERLQDASEASA